MIWSQRYIPILRANQQGLWAKGTVTKKKGGSLTLNGQVDASCYCLLGLLFICFCYSEGGLSPFWKFLSIISGASMDLPLLLFAFIKYQGINIWGSMCFKWDSRTKSGHPSKSIIEAILSVSETENKLDRLMCSASLICTCSQKLRISRGERSAMDLALIY